MCKEADDMGGDAKGNSPNALPEPAQPTPIPQDALVPPQHATNFNHQEPTIANQETFSDKDLSSVTQSA